METQITKFIPETSFDYLSSIDNPEVLVKELLYQIACFIGECPIKRARRVSLAEKLTRELHRRIVELKAENALLKDSKPSDQPTASDFALMARKVVEETPN